MACKLSRRTKKRINNIIKKYQYYDYMTFGFKEVRKLEHQNREYLISKNNKKTKFVASDEVRYLLNKPMHDLYNINYSVRLMVPVYFSSTVKRSRLKNVLIAYRTYRLDTYNEDFNEKHNPVSLYYKICSKREVINAKSS